MKFKHIIMFPYLMFHILGLCIAFIIFMGLFIIDLIIHIIIIILEWIRHKFKGFMMFLVPEQETTNTKKTIT